MGVWGYARISTEEQSLEVQAEVLRVAGVPAENIRGEVCSGATPALRRPVLRELLGCLCPGDSLVVVKLDRLGRDASDVLAVIADLETRKVAVRLLDMGADTGTAAGRLVVQLLAAVAQWERGVMVERTKAGIEAARRAGRHPGRRHSLTPFQREEARRMSRDGRSLRDIARVLGVAKSIVGRAVKEAA